MLSLSMSFNVQMFPHGKVSVGRLWEREKDLKLNFFHPQKKKLPISDAGKDEGASPPPAPDSSSLTSFSSPQSSSTSENVASSNDSAFLSTLKHDNAYSSTMKNETAFTNNSKIDGNGNFNWNFYYSNWINISWSCIDRVRLKHQTYKHQSSNI